jgi:colanic acid biosynthesis glycosyl transferase WcaI
VVTAPPYYPEWQVNSDYSGLYYQTEKFDNLTVFRSPLWVPQKPKTFTRLLHLASFALSSIPQLLRQLSWQPDVIICIAPSFFCAPATLLFSKLSHSRSWLHIQDFEIDAMFGLGMMGNSGVLARFALGIERFLLRRFDRVSSISRSMCSSLQAKGVAEQAIVLFPNCVDTDFITPQADGSKYRRLWGFKPTDKIVLYSGNLGKKQGLMIILEAAEVLESINDLHFVIVGEGVYKSALEETAREKMLKNVHFYPLQPHEALPDLLCMADVHLVIQKRGAADAVMPSKLTGILAVGGYSIITADADTELGRLVRENPGIATLIEPENTEELVTAIMELALKSQNQNGNYNHIARRYAEENIGKESVLGKFELELRRSRG